MKYIILFKNPDGSKHRYAGNLVENDMTVTMHSISAYEHNLGKPMPFYIQHLIGQMIAEGKSVELIPADSAKCMHVRCVEGCKID